MANRSGARSREDTAALQARDSLNLASAPDEGQNLESGIPLSRLVFAIVLVAAFAELGYVVVNVSAMPVYIVAIGLDPKWVAWATGAFLVAEGLLKSPFGVLGDHVGRRALIIGGPAISVCTSLVTPLVHNPLLLVGLRILDGVAAAALWPACFSLIGDHVREERRASAMSYFNVAYLLGIALGPLVGGAANGFAFHHLHRHLSAEARHAASKHASFYVAAILFALTVLVAGVVIPGGKPCDVGQTSPPDEAGFSFRSFLAMLGKLPMLLLMTFVTFLGIGLIMAYVKLFAMHTFHISEVKFGWLLLPSAVVIAALSVPLGTLGDRVGKARAVKIGIATCAVSFWLLIFFLNEITLVVLGTLLGLGFVVAFPAWMALVASASGASQRGAAVGAVGTAQGLGAIVGVAVSSVLYPLAGLSAGPLHIPAHGLPFLGCAAMLTIACVLAFTSVRDTPDARGSAAKA